MVSSRFSRIGSEVLIEEKEKKQETVSSNAIMEVSSSIICVSVRLAIRKEVITKRQKPSRLAEVLRICCDVLFAIFKVMQRKNIVFVNIDE